MIRYGTFLKNSIYAMGYFWKVLFTQWGLSVLIYQKFYLRYESFKKFFLRYEVLLKKIFIRYDILKFLLMPWVQLVQWIGYLSKRRSFYNKKNYQGWKALICPKYKIFSFELEFLLISLYEIGAKMVSVNDGRSLPKVIDHEIFYWRVLCTLWY